jgi:Amt family ammonium transporter
VSVTSAAVIGLIAGLIVVPAVLFFDKLKIDDPVGALSVHLANGIWGTIAVGLFATADAPGGGANGLFNGGGFASLQAQLIGTFAVAGFTLAVTLTAWFVIKTVIGIRVSPEEEAIGLDISEMGMEAYAADPMGQ